MSYIDALRWAQAVGARQARPRAASVDLIWRTHIAALIVAVTVLAASASSDHDTGTNSNPYAAWKNGPPHDPAFFPIAVWLQNPKNAGAYQQAGINTYVALWRGPTDEQLSQLHEAGMKAICSQNAAALRHLTNSTIIGWMHGDEPDNAQSLGQGKGYGPPIAPAKIIADYERIRSTDPSRPVLLNLGQGVAWDNWIGRGVRRNHPEDYPDYVKGSDVVSFDIYPAVHSSPEIAGQLGFVARGVERLVRWTGGRKIVWNCIECTHISNPNRKATPAEVRAEVWMSIIHGSRGLIYFVHQFKPSFNEAALLSDPEMLSAITALNRQITRLAPVLNNPAPARTVQIQCAPQTRQIAVLRKTHQNATYLFTVSMRPEKTSAVFSLPDLAHTKTVTVLDENRVLPLQEDSFSDTFEPWGVHLYKIESSSRER